VQTQLKIKWLQIQAATCWKHTSKKWSKNQCCDPRPQHKFFLGYGPDLINLQSIEFVVEYYKSKTGPEKVQSPEFLKSTYFGLSFWRVRRLELGLCYRQSPDPLHLGKSDWRFLCYDEWALSTWNSNVPAYWEGFVALCLKQEQNLLSAVLTLNWPGTYLTAR